MKINVILRSTGKVVDSITCKSNEHSLSMLSLMMTTQKRMPNSYNRYKRSRKYCYILDKIFQSKSGNGDFWLSMYSGKQYVFIRV